MAYTTQQAIETFKSYLQGVIVAQFPIEGTKDRGSVVETQSGEKFVVFVYPLVHKQDNSKNYFDTRDSGAYERGVAWRYAQRNNLKYFCIGVNDQVDKYQDYAFSLECNESVIETISGTKNGARSGSGNQIIIPNDYIPDKPYERIQNRLGIFISVIHKDVLEDYLEKYDNRPYMNGNILEDEISEEELFSNLMSVENKQFIYTCLSLMEKHNLFNSTTLGILQDKQKCVSMFKHNSVNGILYKVKNMASQEEQDNQKLDADGSKRYYDDILSIDGDEYFVSSEWHPVTDDENPRKPLIDWIFSLMKGLQFHTGIDSEFQRNRIIFGAPGTGKSYLINQQRIELLGADNESYYERVTFHPDYSYANFVGTYKPVMVEDGADVPSNQDTKQVLSILNDRSKTAQEKYDLLYDRFKDEGLTRLPVLLGLYTDDSFKTRKQDGSDAAGDNSVERNHGRAIRKYVKLITGKEKSSDIAYEYVPGPFMRVYVNALKSARTANPKPYLLIIEEINRANVAAVFGDIFQLLDRGDDNVSEYPIQASEDIKKYLAKELECDPLEVEKIRIPDNMFIWATMNSADQGVFPMDTAFKRRWDFTYLGIDDCDELIRGKYVYLADDKSQKVEWNKLRKAINHFLAKEKINEDKQLGPYFISRSIVVPSEGDEIDRDRFIRVFMNKVIMYLYEDAGKQKRAKLFEGCIQDSMRYSEICREFEAKGIGIFNHDIQLETDPEEPQWKPDEDDNQGGRIL